MSENQIQQYLIAIVVKQKKAHVKPVTTVYSVAAKSREEAIATFDEEIGARHREMALIWSCASTPSRVVRVV